MVTGMFKNIGIDYRVFTEDTNVLCLKQIDDFLLKETLMIMFYDNWPTCFVAQLIKHQVMVVERNRNNLSAILIKLIKHCFFLPFSENKLPVLDKIL